MSTIGFSSRSNKIWQNFGSCDFVTSRIDRNLRVKVVQNSSVVFALNEFDFIVALGIFGPRALVLSIDRTLLYNDICQSLLCKDFPKLLRISCERSSKVFQFSMSSISLKKIQSSLISKCCYYQLRKKLPFCLRSDTIGVWQTMILLRVEVDQAFCSVCK